MATTTVYLGNRDAYNATTNADGEVTDRSAVKGKHRTEVTVPDGTRLGDAFAAITAGDGVWANQTLSADATPAWVASDNDSLATLLADHYGCEKRKPVPDGERGEFAPVEGVGDDSTGTTTAKKGSRR